MRKIFSQGDFDGACFLYAMANAYVAVTGRTPGCAEWDRGIAALPAALDFLQGCVGTTRGYDRDRELQTQAVAAMLGSFSAAGPVVRAEWHPDCLDIRSIAGLIHRESVVLFRYRGNTAKVVADDHWVVGVAVTEIPFRLHLACSFRHSQDGRLNGRRYREVFHLKAARLSNDWVTCAHGITIVPDSVYRIARVGSCQTACLTPISCP